MTWADWWLLASGATWVTGAAVVLAAASWAWWSSGIRARSLGATWSDTAWPLWHARGMVLAAIGFGTVPGAAWWERLLWAAVALAFVPAAIGRGPRTPA